MEYKLLLTKTYLLAKKTRNDPNYENVFPVMSRLQSPVTPNMKCVEVGYLTLKYKLINIILHLV